MIWQTTPLTSCCKATGSSKYDSKIAKEYASTFPPLCLPCSLHPDYITTTATSFPYLLRYSFSSLLLSLNFASGGGWRFLALLFFFCFVLPLSALVSLQSWSHATSHFAPNLCCCCHCCQHRCTDGPRSVWWELPRGEGVCQARIED